MAAGVALLPAATTLLLATGALQVMPALAEADVMLATRPAVCKYFFPQALFFRRMSIILTYIIVATCRATLRVTVLTSLRVVVLLANASTVVKLVTTRPTVPTLESSVPLLVPATLVARRDILLVTVLMPSASSATRRDTKLLIASPAGLLTGLVYLNLRQEMPGPP